MTDTPNLALPLIAAAQAQKHVTHNEALYAIDALLNCAVLDKDLAAPPASPAPAARYIVGPSPSGAWSGHSGSIAVWQDGAWIYHDPRPGFLAFVLDESLLYFYGGAAWLPFTSALTAIQNLSLLGIGTTADATNPLSAKLNKTLWTAKPTSEGGTGDLRYTLNKQAAGNTLSFLFQSGYSGRLELGLIGADNPSLKVSPNGFSWTNAVTIDATTGGIDLLASATDVASAATVDLGAQTTLKVKLTGTTAITSFGSGAHKLRFLHFLGVLTLTHNATSLVCPGAANIVTAVGDTAIATSDASGNWTIRHYQRAAQAPGTASSATSNFLPATDAAYGLGSAAFRWSGLYAANVVGGYGEFRSIANSTPAVKANAGPDGYAVDIIPNSSQVGLVRWVNNAVTAEFASIRVPATGDMRFTAALGPSFDNGYNLGSGALRWNEVFGSKHTVDAGFFIAFGGGSPNITMDTGDYIYYDRGNNQYGFAIGGGAYLQHSSTALFDAGDNRLTLGKASNRWSTVYAASGTINTSDATEKTVPRAFTDAELDAWGEISAGVFQFLDAVAAKGLDHARFHFGYTAQAVAAAFRAHGIDPTRHALWCQDPKTRRLTRTRTISTPVTETVSLTETAIEMVDGRAVQVVRTREETRPLFRPMPVFDAAGAPVMTTAGAGEDPVQLTHPVPVMAEIEESYEAEEPVLTDAAGPETRLGLRYDQCAVIEAAWQRRRCDRAEARADRLEARIAALESRAAA